MRPNIGIFISGNGSNMVALITHMMREGYAHPALVLSDQSAAAGLRKAQDLGVATAILPKSTKGSQEEYDAKLNSVLAEKAVDYIALAGFMQILSPQFVTKWAGKIINIHPSLLPAYKGLHTHARAIAAGEKEAGCSVHIVTEALDDGPVLDQTRIPIHAHDTSETLSKRVLAAEHSLYPSVLQSWING